MAADPDYIGRVMRTLSENPTAANLDFLVEAYAVVGNLAADAEGIAEKAEHNRKHMEAVRYLEAKQRQGDRVTDREATAIALVETVVEHHQEAEARTHARMLRNLLDAIEQAINAIKHLDKATTPRGWSTTG